MVEIGVILENSLVVSTEDGYMHTVWLGEFHT